jgi:hypothetical protein
MRKFAIEHRRLIAIAYGKTRPIVSKAMEYIPYSSLCLMAYNSA